MQSANTSAVLQELQTLFSDPDLFSSLDKHFAMFIAGLAQKHKPEAALAAALVSRNTGEGHICLDLAGHVGKPLPLKDRETGMQAFVCPPFAD